MLVQGVALPLCAIRGAGLLLWAGSAPLALSLGCVPP